MPPMMPIKLGGSPDGLARSLTMNDLGYAVEVWVGARGNEIKISPSLAYTIGEEDAKVIVAYLCEKYQFDVRRVSQYQVERIMPNS